MKAINIIEVCTEDTQSQLCYYDLLPPEVKEVVDNALEPINEGSVECEIYEQGLQFLYDYEDENKVGVFVKPGDTIEYMGAVTLYDSE